MTTALMMTVVTPELAWLTVSLYLMFPIVAGLLLHEAQVLPRQSARRLVIAGIVAVVVVTGAELATPTTPQTNFMMPCTWWFCN